MLDTGRVKLHRRQVDPHPRDRLRLPATLVDREWTDWLAVWTFAIEHPEGLVVVDAGQDPNLEVPWWDVYLRAAGAIRLLLTPGHTAGHQSVLVTPSEGPRVLLSGDAVYSVAALQSRTIDGVAAHPDRARDSIDKLREVCRGAPTVVAPTHDPGAAERVSAGQATSV